MLIYNYHPTSGEFAGTVEAEESPFGDGEYLIPAHATTTAPPDSASEGHALVFDGTAWGEVVDHRGETWWTAEGEAMTVQQLGNPIDYGLLREAPPPLPEPEVARLRFALVHIIDGVVLQVLEADCPMQWQLAEGHRMVVDGDARAHPGWLYDGASFQPPPTAPPLRPTEPPNGSA